jgi:hypothetical protein
MKTIILGMFLTASLVQAETDLSGLYGKRTEPTVTSIKTDYEKFKMKLAKTDITPEQEALISSFEKALEATVVKPNLKRKASRGPSWKKLAIDYIDSETDIHENVSYSDEDGHASEACNFDDDGVQEMDFWHFEWDSVKHITGSQKSIAYFAILVVPLKGKDIDTGEMNWCDYRRSEYAFEAKLINGKPAPIL